MDSLINFVSKLEDLTGIPPLATIPILFLIVFLLFAPFLAGDAFTTLQILWFIVLVSPIWMPIVLLYVLWKLWVKYVQVKELITTDYDVLEIRLPAEITQSPLAMETVINVMYHTGEPEDWKEAYVEGKLPLQFSLEIASIEGDVRFYIRTRKKRREILEAQIYSQYPSVEIVEVEDYAARFQYDEKTMKLFGMEMKLRMPDPYPIKTYVDWGLDKDPKDEFRVDPINSLLEFMGSIGKGEFCFVQFIITSHQKTGTDGEGNAVLQWQVDAEKEVDKILRRDPKTKGTAEKTAEGYAILPTLPEEERKKADAILRNTSKKPFDTGIRVIYMGYNDNYNSNLVSGIPTMFRTFESHTLNGFKPRFPTMFRSWNFADPLGWRAAEAKREVFQAYRWRSFIFPPYERRPLMVLSGEELATLYHFPTRSTATPTLHREPSRKGEAPSNLPR